MAMNRATIPETETETVNWSVRYNMVAYSTSLTPVLKLYKGGFIKRG